jgi:hypothetical protein
MRAMVSRRLALAMAVAVFLGGLVPASAPAQEPAKAAAFKPEEIEQLVAPIALYPDALLAQVLMASTYPLDIVHAARFAKDNAKLTGDPLNEALKAHPWDDSVKSLVAFPQVLTMMNEKLDWTQKLGDAFLASQQDVMAAVQRLRGKAQAAGNLKTTPEQKVTVEPAAAPPAPTSTTVVVQQAPPTVIKIEQANPQVVYVPTYNPVVVYGAWPYPAYPPYYYYPPGYVAGQALAFGAGVAVGAALWGNCNWHGHGGDVNVNVSNYQSYSRTVNNTNVANQRVQAAQRPATGQGAGQGNWQHTADRRGAVPYRDQATAQAHGRGASQQAAAQSREAFRGRTPQAGATSQQGLGGQRSGGSAPRATTMENRGGAGAGQARTTQAQGGQRAAQPAAFEGLGQGGASRQSSARGAQSLESSRNRGASPSASQTRSGGGGSRSGGGGSRGGGRGR